MKTVLVHPPEPIASIASQVTQHPINLASLAAWLIRDGHEVAIWDYGVQPYDDRGFVERIRREAPDVIGFSCMTPLIKTGGRLAALVKQHFPDIVTVVGGPHVSAIPLDTMNEFPGFDVGVIGEGEETLSELMVALDRQGHAGGVLGTVHRATKSGEPIVEDQRALIGDLDRLPIPARHLLDFPAYIPFSSTPGVHSKNLKLTQLFTSRGCPVKCIFCASHVTHRNKVRFRSAEHVLAEVRDCVERYGIQHFTIDDDTFTYGRKRLFEVCDGLRELGVSWDCDSRVDSVNPEILDYMKKAGCKKIAFGVESGSPAIQVLIKKRITNEKIERAFRWASDVKMITSAFVMICSHPDEDVADLEQTYKLMARIKPDYVLVYVAIPYPGTELRQIMLDREYIFSEDWDEYEIVRTQPKWRTKHFEPDQLVALQKRMYRRIYFHPWFIWKKLAAIRSADDLAYFWEATKAFVSYIFLQRGKKGANRQIPEETGDAAVAAKAEGRTAP